MTCLFSGENEKIKASRFEIKVRKSFSRMNADTFPPVALICLENVKSTPNKKLSSTPERVGKKVNLLRRNKNK